MTSNLDELIQYIRKILKTFDVSNIDVSNDPLLNELQHIRNNINSTIDKTPANMLIYSEELESKCILVNRLPCRTIKSKFDIDINLYSNNFKSQSNNYFNFTDYSLASDLSNYISLLDLSYTLYYQFLDTYSLNKKKNNLNIDQMNDQYSMHQETFHLDLLNISNEYDIEYTNSMQSIWSPPQLSIDTLLKETKWIPSDPLRLILKRSYQPPLYINNHLKVQKWKCASCEEEWNQEKKSYLAQYLVIYIYPLMYYFVIILGIFSAINAKRIIHYI